MLRQTIRKLSLTLLGAAAAADVMSIILVFSMLVFTKYAWVNFITLALTLVLYTALLYSRVWEEGNRDPNRVEYGRMKKCMLKGLYAGLFADIPFFVAWLLMVVAYIVGWHCVIFRFVHMFLNFPFFYPISLMKTMPWLTVVFLFPMPLITWGGYVLGYHHISITRLVMYKRK